MVAQFAPVFDGHNDVLLKIYNAGGVNAAPGFVRGMDGALDLPKARAGGFVGGFFAHFVSSADDMDDDITSLMSGSSYDLPLPKPVDWAEAIKVVLAQAAILRDLEGRGALQVVTSVYDIQTAMARGQMAAIFHMEGAEAIDPDFHTLDVLYAAGLRSLGPVWSRPTIFGEGVPFRYPSTGDIGAGLTDHGKGLIQRCNDLRIMVDLSHLNEAGFWDVARLSDAPLVATHSNAYALCPHARNLSDKQLHAIAESDGMVGLNFATAFLRADGQMGADMPIETMLRHLDYMMGILGEDRVGLGSDYDGATVPQDVTTVADLPVLVQAMRDHGYGEALIEKLCYRNWLRVLADTWGR